MFTLFFFILFGNLLGVFPLFLHLHQPHRGDAGAVVFVFLLVTFVAIKEHGLHFFSYFVPQGIPIALAAAAGR